MNYRLQEFQRDPNERRQGRRWFRYHWRQSWREWMDRRLPPARRIELSHRNIFISPSKAGFAYIGLCLVLLLIAINFQNSAVYGLTFLLLSVFVVSIFHTFRNLSGVILSAVPGKAVFAGNEALFTTAVTSSKLSRHYSLCLSWQDKESVYFDVEPGTEQRVSLRYQVGPRGLCKPGRLKVESRYPLGLLSSRTYVDLCHEVVVYPFPVDRGQSHPHAESSYEAGPVEKPGSDDYYALRDYQQGDRVKHIAWRSYAKNNRLVVKQFVDYYDQRNCFDWETLYGNTEERLSQIAYWALLAESSGEKYALKLPGTEIDAGCGSAHLARVLQALALYGSAAQPVSAEPISAELLATVDLDAMRSTA